MTQEKLKSDIMLLIEKYGSIDGAHHKQWVIDQIARIICGDIYKAWAASMREDDYTEDGDHIYSDWDTGIAP